MGSTSCARTCGNAKTAAAAAVAAAMRTNDFICSPCHPVWAGSRTITVISRKNVEREDRGNYVVPRRLAVVRLDRAADLDGERAALAVHLVAHGDANPFLADAVFLDVVAFLAVEADADVVLENGRDVVRAGGVDGEAVG